MTPLPTTDPRPLYAGRLSIETSRAQPPLLFVSFRCGSCKRHHHHTWSLAEDGAETWTPAPRQPHCDRPDLFPTGYLVGPADSDHNHRVYAQYAAMVERHASTSKRALRRAGAAAGAGATAAAG